MLYVVENPRLRNYIYQILITTGEGKFFLKAYEAEFFKKIKKKPTAKQNAFCLSKVARIVLWDEIDWTGTYE